MSKKKRFIGTQLNEGCISHPMKNTNIPVTVQRCLEIIVPTRSFTFDKRKAMEQNLKNWCNSKVGIFESVLHPESLDVYVSPDEKDNSIYRILFGSDVPQDQKHDRDIRLKQASKNAEKRAVYFRFFSKGFASKNNNIKVRNAD